MKNKSHIELPEEMKDVMVTFIAPVYVPDKYYGYHDKQIITKRGFFSTLMEGYYNAKNEWVSIPEGFFSIPPGYKEFNGVLLPDGWGGHKVRIDKVIKWEYCKD